MRIVFSSDSGYASRIVIDEAVSNAVSIPDSIHMIIMPYDYGFQSVLKRIEESPVSIHNSVAGCADSIAMLDNGSVIVFNPFDVSNLGFMLMRKIHIYIYKDIVGYRSLAFGQQHGGLSELLIEDMCIASSDKRFATPVFFDARMPYRDFATSMMSFSNRLQPCLCYSSITSMSAMFDSIRNILNHDGIVAIERSGMKNCFMDCNRNLYDRAIVGDKVLVFRGCKLYAEHFIDSLNGKICRFDLTISKDGV